jgi:hypothetical protein
LKLRKLITTGILVTFVIQALVVLAINNSNRIANVSILNNEKGEKIRNEPSIFGNYFFENIGQFDENQITYYGFMPGGMIGFGESKVFLKTTDSNQVAIVYFENAQNVKPIAQRLQESNMNYFIGDNNLLSNIMKCEKIAFYNLWSGIDLFYKITNEGIKYEYHVNVGANVQDIKIRYEGLDCLPVIKSDRLLLYLGSHQIVDEGLYVFQENNINIDAKFISEDRITFGFDVSTFDTTQKLIIDPLIYSTYIGGSDYEKPNDIFIDDDGNTYLVGSTSSTDFPTSVTAYNDTFYGPSEDVFVLKLSADGSTLLYSTFIGGNGTDYGYSIVVDDSGCAFITGSTDSYNFPTANAYDDSYNGKLGQYGDCFVLKLSADGSSILYSTFFGGSGDDVAFSLALDATKNIILTGQTSSTNFPLQSAIDDEFNGVVECFFAKIAANGLSIIFSTYYGETESGGTEQGKDIAIGSDDSIYFLGNSYSDNITMTDETIFGSYTGSIESFLVKLASDGSLQYSSYIGGFGMDYTKSMTIDDSDNLFILLETTSPDLPIVNAYDGIYDAWTDAHLMKIAMNESTPDILYATFLGGMKNDYPQDLCIDIEGNAYVTGYTTSDDYATTENAFDKELSGTSDAYLTVISSDGSDLIYSTFIGGSLDEWGFTVCVNSTLDVVIAGTTNSIDFPTEAAYDDSLSGSYDVFVVYLKIEMPQGKTSLSIYWIFTTVFVVCTTIFLISKKKSKN